MKQILKLIADEMQSAGIDYHFQVNKKSPPSYPYHVGELIPVNPDTEDGKQEFTLVLDGYNRKSKTSDGTLYELLTDAQKIEERFSRVGGLVTLRGNQAIAIYYLSCQSVESGDEQLQKIQTLLQVKSWKS